MDIRQDDEAITAELAKTIAANATDDSLTRDQFREVMKRIKYRASYGYTSAFFLFERRPMQMEVVDALEKLGYKYSCEIVTLDGMFGSKTDEYTWKIEW